jgi:hypothetical protein
MTQQDFFGSDLEIDDAEPVEAQPDWVYDDDKREGPEVFADWDDDEEDETDPQEWK